MKLLINPKYERVRPFLEHIDTYFTEGRSLRESRNSLRVCQWEDLELNVKRFRQPSFFQRLVYTFLRRPKGLRAYENPFRMHAAGVDSPEPVAYLERRKGGLIAESFFVSVQCPYTRRFYEFATAPLTPEVLLVARSFARLTARLHEAGILHLDYSPGNILFEVIDGEPHFSLVDTNRMRFGSVSVAEGCRNFARLWGQPPFFEAMADAYAEARHASPADCRQLMLSARRKFWKRYIRRHGAPFEMELLG